MFFGTKEQRRGAEVWDCSRVHFLDHMRLWSRDEGTADPSQWQLCPPV